MESICSKPAKKFVRSINFSQKEENILLSIIKKYKNEIECKSTDSNIRLIKKQAWMKVTREFNMISGETARDETTLKNKYENIKKRSKEKYANQKNYFTGTGGGPSQDICLTSTDNNILDIIGTQMTGNNSEFDDDTVGESIVLSFQENNEENVEYQEMEISGTQWLAADSAKLLKTQKSQYLNTSAPGPLDNFRCNISTAASSSSTILTPIKKATETNLTTENSILNPIETPTKTGLKNNSTETSTKKTTLKRKLIKSAGFGPKAEEWAQSKVVLEEIKKQSFIEEHQLKLKQRKQRHEKDLELMESESKEKRKWAFEEHKEKLQILRLEKEVLQRKLNKEL